MNRAILFAAVILGFSLTSQAEAEERFYPSGEGSAHYASRKPFRLIQTQNENVAPFTLGAPLSHDPSGWGGSWAARHGYHLTPDVDLEISFMNSWVDQKRSLKTQAGDTGGSSPTRASIIPIISGSFRPSGVPFQQAVEVGGQVGAPNALADVTFKYKSIQYDVQADLIFPLQKSEKSSLDGLFGFGYAYFNQKATFQTVGGNFGNGGANQGTTITHTRETLGDNLFGVLGGLRGKVWLNRFLTAKSSGTGFLYVRSTHFKGYQNFSNASYPFTGFSESFEAGLNDSETAVVPRLRGEVSFSTDPSARFVLEVFYSFDVWWNMSRVDNPTVRVVGGNDVIDHPARIGSETLYEHFIGGRAIYSFD